MRRQRLVKAAEPQNQRGLTRFQLSQMLDEKTKAFKDVRARLRLVLERKPRILPPVKVHGTGVYGRHTMNYRPHPLSFGPVWQSLSVSLSPVYCSVSSTIFV